MDEQPEGQRPTSAQRVTEPAAYLALVVECVQEIGRNGNKEVDMT